MRNFIAATLFFALTAGLVPGAADADIPKDLTDQQRSQIESLIEDYIVNNPEVIVDAVRRYQAEQRIAEEAAKAQRLVELQEQLENSETSPVGGNPNGDVTLVEFFDYRCGYCKRVHDTVVNTVKADGNIRLVYKEFPILGPASMTAARVALAVHFAMPEKYKAFNDSIMRSRGSLTEERLFQIAEDFEISPDTLRSAMEDPRVEQEIRHNMALAQALEINGTPAFVIGNRIVPGAVDAETLQKLIEEARQG